MLSSDAPYLGASSGFGPCGEAVSRRLQLKGSYEGGVRHLQEPQQRQSIDEANSALIRAWIHSQRWDGILLGNLDLIGPELLPALLGLHASFNITWALYTPLPTYRLASE